jgi:hypothetical protein
LRESIKKIGCLALFLGIFFTAPKNYKRWTHSFRPSKCLIECPSSPEWKCPPPTSEIKAILEKTFSYFDRGRQCYVFLSEDGKYVLKLFRFDSCPMKTGSKILNDIRALACAKIDEGMPFKENVQKTLGSCSLAYHRAQNQTGVVFIHLNLEEKGIPPLTIKDRLGRTFDLDASKYRFVLQRKAEPFRETLLHSKDKDAQIASYFALLEELKNLGLVHLDRTMGRNFGYLDGKAVLIDIGDLAYLPEKAGEEMAHFETRFKAWLEKYVYGVE